MVFFVPVNNFQSCRLTWMNQYQAADKVPCSGHNTALHKVSKSRFRVRTTLEPLYMMSILKAMHQKQTVGT